MACGVVVCVYIFVSVIILCLDPSLSYHEYTFYHSKVCSSHRKRDLKLQEKENSGIMVKEHGFFNDWSGTTPFNCTFTVLAPHKYGIIAVIQNVVLRQNETTKECIDYVQFHRQERKHLFQRSKTIWSDKFCGNVNSFHNPYEVIESGERQVFPAYNSFVDESGRVDVTISVAAQRFLPSEARDISIVFTGFRVCTELNSNEGFRECNKGSNICIWEGFFDDKIVNCPYNDCADEGGCPVIFTGGKKQGSGLGTKVTIGAVVAILSLLLLFLLCLCACRHCKVLCWAATPSRAQSTVRVEMTLQTTNAGGTTGQQPQQQPSAPPLLAVTLPVHEDKDLPPPYESLFPSR